MEQDHLPEKGEGITEIKIILEIYVVCKLIFKSIYVTEKPLLSAMVFYWWIRQEENILQASKCYFCSNALRSLI